MHLRTRNVNTAFRDLVKLFKNGGKVREARTSYDDDGNPLHTDYVERELVVKKPSRNGNVMMIDEPVTLTYSHPRERVLFNAARDANPFFHLYEALWMLAGRNDVTPLAYYAKKMKEFSDDGVTTNGAYGYRWRTAMTSIKGFEECPSVKLAWHKQHGGIDQLDILVNHLKADPNSRRAVLQMWNVEDDLLKIGGGVCRYCNGAGDKFNGDPNQSGHCPECDGTHKDKGSRDTCCNLSVMFSIRQEEYINREAEHHMAMPVRGTKTYLDMTVTNRSNDLIWGLLGANYCHFTFLQEYMAARLGAEVGKYHHFTNNLHVYDWNWKPEEWLNAKNFADGYSLHTDAPGCMISKTVPLIKNVEVFEDQLRTIVDFYDGGDSDRSLNLGDISEPFLRNVASPTFSAFKAYKRSKAKDSAGIDGRESMDHALEVATTIMADDWRLACTEWLKRRAK